MRRTLAWGAYILSITSHWWWEFVRTFILYEPASHMLREQIGGISVDTLAQLGGGFAFFVLGTWLIWPSRPDFLKPAILEMFLERDSATELLGIQTFPNISYVQISVKATKQVTQCRARCLRVHFSPDGTVPYALEHNERHPLPWSKSGLVTDISPSDGAIRINVAVYNKKGIEFDPEVQTPTNLHPYLQRRGITVLK